MRNLLWFVFVFFLFTSITLFAQQPVNIIWEADAKASTLAFSYDGLTMYTGGLEIQNPYSYGNIKKWDVQSKNLLFTVTSVGTMIGLTNDITVNRTGSYIASGHGDIYCIPPSGACVNVNMGFNVLHANGGGPAFQAPGLDGIVTGVSFSYDGSYAAMGMRRTLDPQINVYRTSDYQLTNSFSVDEFGSYSLAFSTTENILAAGMWQGHINLYNITTNQLVKTLQHGNYTQGGYPVSLAFSPNGNLLASAGNGFNTVIKIWNAQTGALIHTLEGVYDGSADAAFSPNGEYIAAGFREYVWGTGTYRGLIRIWKVSDGSLVREYVDNSGTVNSAGVTSIAFSAIGDNWFGYTCSNKVKFAETDLIFNTTVPVELTSFTVSVTNSSVILNWKTATETNNKGFEVERKKAEDNNWSTAGFVQGQGTTSESQSYQFIDNHLSAGKYSYRLRQIDFDGSYEYSSVVNTEVSLPAEYILYQNYPNPFNPATFIRYEIPQESFVKLQVFDMLGNEIASLVNKIKNAGSHSVEFNGENLSSGVYIAKIIADSYTSQIKLILTK